VEKTFDIPIADYVEVNFEGLTNMVNAVGGVYLDFSDPVYDTDSHLGITKTGCHLVLGSQALALVRSRHLYYFTDGYWHYDGLSDWSRIQRQDAFFRALLPRLKSIVTNPSGLNDLLAAVKNNVTIDKNLSEGELISLARLFRHVSASALVTETLPTIPYTTAGGADVLLPAQSADETMINEFLALGSSASKAATTSAATTGATPTVELDAAHLLLPASVTVTTLPGEGGSGSATIVYNNQPEPWNPVPCTPGG
jgi:anionic cell wall polymer biosynthesis LytR-Cps2A-Psr (LCP) family protein